MKPFLHPAGMLLAALIVTTIGCKPPASTTAPTTLDGKTFIGESKEPGKSGAEKDEITFASGRLHSKGCDVYGFGDAPYSSTSDANGIHFNAVTTSEKEGSIAWSGTVSGDAITGKMVWTKQGQSPITYDVTGTLKK